MTGYAESALVAEAKDVLGSDEQILAAGIFGLTELTHAQAKGGVLGGLLGALAPGGLDVLAGTLIGGIIGRHDAAARSGASVQLLVAITPDTIHVLNRDASGSLDTEYASFPRATTTVSVRPVGLSRRLTLTEPGHDATVELHGTVSGVSDLTEGDRLVLELLDPSGRP
ncbi:hypothetical protein ACTU3I_04355 [Microbacterium sp. RD1]|uniref:hypothetical protein n=1 Tax=Microbacterium sp. RD1 TaxID=3457313 RepID=UPI003FA5697E